MNVLRPLLFAMIAAVGNAIFALGQRKSSDLDNTISYTVISVTLCILFTALAVPLFGKYDYIETIKTHWQWALVSGFGLFVTYIGFNLLYSRCGVANYVLYAILSIITTSVIVGVFVLKETLNPCQYTAIVLSIVAIALFFMGK